MSAAEGCRPKTDMANKTERADNMAFLRECVDTYYRVAKEALRRYDTNHMFFGDKTNANGDALDNIADIAARYCDVTYFQSYGHWSHERPRYDRWSAMTGLPLVNGDSSYGAPKEHMPNPGGTKVRDEAQRAAATREFCENAFARPDFVGWHICGILEMWDTMPGQQQRQKIGIKSPTGEFCPEITATVQDISARLYQTGSGQERGTPNEANGTDRTRPDYSGRDVRGIERIIREAENGADAWRREANRRIDELRKAELVIQVVDDEGTPQAGIPVRVEMKRHLFRFGGIVGGQSMHEPAPGQKPRGISPEQYKEMFLELGFNTAGFNKYLKYKQRSRSEPHLPALFAWFQEHDIPVRGHCLMWPGGVFMNFMPPELSEMVYVPDPSIDWSSLKKGVPREDLTPSEKQAVRDLCKKMIEEASREWPVLEWDVINETRDNHVVQDLVGKDVMVDWFRVARQNTADRNALLYLNEYRIISDPAPEVVTSNMKQYEHEIRYLLDQGAPILAIGFQSRFHARTPPETIYKRLCYFEQFNLPYAATEFEMNDTVGDEFERAAMTERAMTVLFSHRSVNGIYAWSLLAQDQGGPRNRAILEDDGRLKLRGKVWMYLMKNRWWTDESLRTDANGTVTLRGFKGRYEVTVGKNPAGKPIQLNLVDDQDTEVTVPSK